MQRHVMLRIRVLFFFMVAVATGQASITAAWKIPVESVAPSFADAPPLESPPGESAFFQPGDKLWDLSKCLNWKIPAAEKDGEVIDPFAEPKLVDLNWKGDWIVWNSRSGMIVTRGPLRDVFVAEHVLGFEDLPAVIRTHVEVKSGGKARSLSLISRSSEKSSIQMGDLRAEVEAVITMSPAVTIDVPFRVSWIPDENRGTWEVSNSISMREGRPYRLARHGTGDRLWEVMVSAERETPDGVPWKELRQLETSQGVRLWADSNPDAEQVQRKLDENRWLGVYPMNSSSVARLLVDERFPLGLEITPTPEIAEWNPSMLIDLRPMLEGRGVDFFHEGSMAALDPLSSTVFVITNKEGQEMVESLLQPACWLTEWPIWIETNSESGNWGLATRSGEKAEIRRASSDPGNQLLFNSESIRGNGGEVFDLRYAIDVVADDAKIGKLESATTLMKDKPQVIGCGVTSDGKEVKVTVTVSEPMTD